MAIRIFRCHECKHRMRMSQDTCGRCNEDKRRYQRLYFYAVPAVFLLFTAPSLLSL